MTPNQTAACSLYMAVSAFVGRLIFWGVFQRPLTLILSMVTPAEPRGEKNLFLCKVWAVKNLKKNLLKGAGEIFLSGLRGANNFSVAFRIVFRIFFSRFSNRFRIDLKVFRGQFRSVDMLP